MVFSIALSNSKTENGCLKFLKKKRSVEYEILKSKENMLARGQNAILNPIQYDDSSPIKQTNYTNHF